MVELGSAPFPRNLPPPRSLVEAITQQPRAARGLELSFLRPASFTGAAGDIAFAITKGRFHCHVDKLRMPLRRATRRRVSRFFAKSALRVAARCLQQKLSVLGADQG